MKKNHLVVIAFAIFFLFLIQMAGTLVESIYILDLMNTSLDEKALGVLFFFSPILLYIIPKKHPRKLVWVIFGLLFLARGLTPYLNTLGRMLASGLGTGAVLTLFPFLVTAKTKTESRSSLSLWMPPGLALAVGFSVLLRTINYGLDYSLLPEGGWVGWALGAALGYLLIPLDWTSPDKLQSKTRSATLPVTGIFLVLGLVYFAFSAPSVIARWTEGNYRVIVMAVSLLALGWVGVSVGKPRWIDQISSTWLLIWNLLFTIAITMTILAHRVPFPQTPDSAPVVVPSPGWLQQLPLVFTLLLFPVIFLDLRIFSSRIRQADPVPRELIPGTLLGSFSLVGLIFMQIFTNVWGYVEPVSPWFRNKFWLPYLLMAGLISLLIGQKESSTFVDPERESKNRLPSEWAFLLGLMFLATAGSALYTTRVQTFEAPDSSLVVMTYNIQQANDDFGERSYREQLRLIKEVEPDILALQESDSTRISLNNNDFVRYFAGKLGYYTYFGPSTVTGTYGTAILSKYPLQNTRTTFTFSSQDEIGTAEAEIVLDGHPFTIYNVHPAGSDEVMLIWAETLLERSQGKSNVIALGDYNLRDTEEAYQLIASVYTNAWESVYPTKIGSDGTDMSGHNRIDHIFVSPSLKAQNPVYILPPQSATDHPVHWAELLWIE